MLHNGPAWADHAAASASARSLKDRHSSKRCDDKTWWNFSNGS